MDIERYIEGWRARARHEAEAAQRAQEDARRAAARVVPLLVSHGARTVWLVGSLPRGTFRPGSDIDFLVEGIPEERISQAAFEAADLTHFDVDVLRAESLDPAWRRYLERYGERLYG